jgi:5-hydroxyisourate hydrolase
MSPITSHVLDTARGRPARQLKLTLARMDATGTWRTLAERLTNDDGRVTDLLAPGTLEVGTHRLIFDTGAYFRANAEQVFYPEVVVVFSIESTSEHYHVPLLLSPFGYSTYRGS